MNFSPGMNRCDVSEDETNSYNAVQWTYPSDTGSVYQYDNQAHAVNTNCGGSSAGFCQNCESFNSGHICDQVKKQKLKEKQMNTALFGSKKNLLRPTLKTEGYAKSTLDLQHPNNSSTEVPKLKKRKNEHVIDGESHMLKVLGSLFALPLSFFFFLFKVLLLPASTEFFLYCVSISNR